MTKLNFRNVVENFLPSPRLPSWASDLIKTDESIIAGIESAGKKYDDGEKAAKEERAMTSSSGFDVDCLENKKDNKGDKSAKKAAAAAKEEEDEDEEEFSFRPAYSRNRCCKVVGKLAQQLNQHGYFSNTASLLH